MRKTQRALAALPPVQVQVVDLSHEGRGVARLDGRVIFVDDALPGETVDIQLLRQRKGVVEARVVNIVQAAADRVAPLCQHYGVCGGCVEQHISVTKQIAIKQTQLLETLARIGQVTPLTMLPPLQATVWGYRRRARLGVRWVAQKNRVLVGFRERSSAKLADLQRCEVLRPPLDGLIVPLSQLIGALSVRERIPQLEVAVADNATAIVMRVLSMPTAADVQLLQQFMQQHAVQLYLQPGGYDTVTPLDAAITQPLLYRLPEFDIEFEFLPNDFVQVNAALNQQMVQRALQLLEVNATDTVFDLFCGLGNFTLPVARTAAMVYGFEGDAQLVARARTNALRNGISNTQFVLADLFADPTPTHGNIRCTRVLLDPPRAGAQAVLPFIARSGAERIVYISCHPGSLARDAGILVREFGYVLQSAGVMDMFPHTAHVESMAVLTLPGSAAA